ncbi:hypothetical protein FA15DRAFT_676495 [Coprinopsis marcescibilis]|uniref:Uncharacterized protein n=1 Tax=Coprinopsis marcescibilis TaxID=230819 RepID=A0A5C3KB26_COPMA|nr:hypothetical protein FA15DRAFT_676495 [Coprinopsis marcescibilis]
MESLPAEIHAYIAYFTCLTDYGPTMRSFGLVSTYFAEVCGAFRYRTIALHSERSILSLAESVQSRPSHTLNVRNMFIAYPELATANPNLQNKLLQLITQCAPTLHSLTVDCTLSLSTSTTLFSRIFRLHFPTLLELKLAGFYPFPNSVTSSQLPHLRRLHLHGNRNPHGLLQVGNLAGSCPNLTQLHISGLSMALAFAMELAEALDTHVHPADAAIFDSPCPSPPPSPSQYCPDSGSTIPTSIADMFSLSSPTVKFPAKLPHSVKHVVVQPAPELEASGSEGTRGNSRTAVLKDQAMMASLTRIVTRERAQGDGVGIDHAGAELVPDRDIKGLRYTLLPRATRAVSSGEIYKEWKRRISGEGHW